MKEIRRIQGLSILEMFERNAFKYGFWFDSWRWANTVCRVLYFEYRGIRIPEHKPIIIWDSYKTKIKVICEFWNIRQRRVIKVDEIRMPWRTDEFEMWKIEKKEPSPKG